MCACDGSVCECVRVCMCEYVRVPHQNTGSCG